MRRWEEAEIEYRRCPDAGGWASFAVIVVILVLAGLVGCVDAEPVAPGVICGVPDTLDLGEPAPDTAYRVCLDPHWRLP